MSKTLGQVAYEAHTPDWHVSFDGLREQYQQAWQAAAEAVVKAAPVSEARSLAEIAVIEAVRDEINSPLAMRSWANLEDAIRALDSEEE